MNEYIDFSPVTEEELLSERLLPIGYYKFKVIEAKHATSQAGKAKINLKLTTLLKGKERSIYCDMMFHAMKHIPKHFFDSCNRPDVYASGRISPKECIGQTVYGEVTISPSLKDAKQMVNQIKDFITEEHYQERLKESDMMNAPTQEFDDEIKF